MTSEQRTLEKMTAIALERAKEDYNNGVEQFPSLLNVIVKKDNKEHIVEIPFIAEADEKRLYVNNLGLGFRLLLENKEIESVESIFFCGEAWVSNNAKDYFSKNRSNQTECLILFGETKNKEAFLKYIELLRINKNGSSYVILGNTTEENCEKAIGESSLIDTFWSGVEDKEKVIGKIPERYKNSMMQLLLENFNLIK